MSQQSLVLPAYAKLNLELLVKGALPDGRHELDTVFQSVSLHDLLEVAPSGRTELGVEGEAPAGQENLVLRAAAALEEACGRPLPARFRLLKRIPAGSGLGGGSSDAAAALRGLRRLFELDVDLQPVAAAIGADVPFCLRGGRAAATGAGDLLSALPAGDLTWYALAWPGYGISTAEVYRRWDEVGGGGRNHLQAAACAVEPRLAGFASRLGEGWVMTGSGSAFFKEFRTRPEAVAAVAGLDCWAEVAWAVPAW